MEHQPSPALQMILGRLATFVARRAWWVLLAAGLATIFCSAYAFRHMSINTDMTQMLASDLPFKESLDQYNALFPQLSDSIVMVIEADTPELAHATVKALGARLRQERELIMSVYTPSAGQFFETHALLYEDLTDLERVASTVEESELYVGQLMGNPSLLGLLQVLNESYERNDWDNAALLDSFFLRMSQAIQASLLGLDYTLSWHSVILHQNTTASPTRRFVVVQPRLDYRKILPAGPALETIRRVIDESKVQLMPGVRVRVTGEVALAHEELLVVSQRAGLAAFLALLMICLILLLAFRSWRLMFTTLLVLLVGLALSAGFATLAIGHLNVISLTFAVLFVGLAVDYTIHLCLRHRELLRLGVSLEEALVRSVRDVGPSLLLCTVTTSLGFYAFVPTNYVGMSEMGLISGTSMLIGLLLSLTLLPALLTVWPCRPGLRGPTADSSRALNAVYEFPLNHGFAIRWGTLAVAVLALGILPLSTFDRNPHNLRDPGSESASTLGDLLETGEGAPWTLNFLAPDEESAWDYFSRLSKLETVERVRTAHDFVPMDQLEKFDVLLEMADRFLPGGVGQRPQSPTGGHVELIPTLESFLDRLDQHIAGREEAHDPDAAIRLRARGRTLLAQLRNLEEKPKQRLLERLHQSLLGSLPSDLENADPSNRMGMVSVEKLPAELYERWVSKDGVYRIQVYPKQDLRDARALRDFVNEVRRIAPEATGLPVTYLDGSQEVVRAFGQAFALAILGITGILALVFRNVRDTLFVILPLCLAGLLTGAATVALDMPFNYANILALPLIFGLGADSGIHIVERMRRMPARCADFLRSSTIRGVFFSGLTTILSFSNLAHTPHVGVSSMGQLLALGVFLTLLCTLVVLPAFLYGDPRHLARAGH